MADCDKNAEISSLTTDIVSLVLNRIHKYGEEKIKARDMSPPDLFDVIINSVRNSHINTVVHVHKMVGKFHNIDGVFESGKIAFMFHEYCSRFADEGGGMETLDNKGVIVIRRKQNGG